MVPEYYPLLNRYFSHPIDIDRIFREQAIRDLRYEALNSIPGTVSNFSKTINDGRIILGSSQIQLKIILKSSKLQQIYIIH